VMAYPPGTYRPMGEMNRITPQVGTYRFRSLTSDEKARMEKTGRQHNNHDNDRAQTQYKFRGQGSSSMTWSPGSVNQPFFRPDDRFTEKETGQAYPYPPYQSQDSYSPSYWAPLFRPDNQNR
jgi:hypothetical protein